VSPQLTRYILLEQTRPFLFFVLVFTGVIWLSQSLRVIETVVNNGQAAQTLLEFSVLLLPQVMAVVLPVSAFGASLYAVNKLFTESELVAMSAAGMSRLSLARPVCLFGGLVALAMALNTMVVMPLAERSFREQVASLRADIANGLLFEGRFLNPAQGLTVYVRESDGSGAMLGVFVHDARDPEAELTYTAREALLQRTEEGPRLVMSQGLAQRYDTEAGQLSVLRFDSLVYDLSPFLNPVRDRMRRPSEHFVTDLVVPRPDLVAVFGLGRVLAEGHEQLSAPLYALMLPLVGLAGVVGSGFTRHGYGRRIVVTIAAGAALRLAGVAVKAAVGGAPLLWPAFYLPPLIGTLGALWWMHSSARRRFARAGMGATA
jgi:lipopolysaccharide export system permease protein